MGQTSLTSALRHAAVRAVLAPSVHNTQPWRLVLGPARLEVHADWSRWLPALDGHGRQLLLSCGCALLNARCSLAAAGLPVRVDRFPDPLRPLLLATIVVLEESSSAHQEAEADPAAHHDADADPATDADLAGLDAAVEDRRTNRTRFDGEPPPAELLDRLVDVATHHGVELLPLTERQARSAAQLSRVADKVADATPGYRHELRAWTEGNAGRRDGVSGDGVLRTRPRVDTHGMGWLPAFTGAGALLVLGTRHDSQAAWLQAGEALERVLLTVTAAGLAVSTLSQVVEVDETNNRLRRELGLTVHPQVLLRVGRARSVPSTRRRRLVDVLSEAG